MTFQSSVGLTMASGVPGELYADGPLVATSYILNSAQAAYNVIGATAYTLLSDGVAQAGGTGVFAGILSGPKQQASLGSSAGTLAPTLTLPNLITAELTSLAPAGLFVSLPAPANIGDKILYSQTSGALSSQPATTSLTGSISGTTLTVAALATGSAPLAIGQSLSGANVTPGTLITAGSGSSWTVNVSQTAASGAITAPSLPPAGFSFVPHASVIADTVTTAGLAVIALTYP